MSLSTDGQNTFNKNINKERWAECGVQLWVLQDKDFCSFWWVGMNISSNSMPQTFFFLKILLKWAASFILMRVFD